ncbi:MAG: biotin synthase BioB [Planctomycetaceae bacterium]|jgi:biotin synthase|nr:biotin synthase BioB [Planctomycetaceae bacterium]
MLSIYDIANAPLVELMLEADRLRSGVFANHVDLCAIVNIKSGRCDMNCRFCAQSKHYQTGVDTYPLRDTSDLIESTRTIWKNDVRRVGWVASGCKLSQSDLDKVLIAADKLALRNKSKTSDKLSSKTPSNGSNTSNESNTSNGSNTLNESNTSDVSNPSVVSGGGEAGGVLCCASFGQLDTESLKRLQSAGFAHYHHNLETSERFYPNICTTQRWRDRLSTLYRVLDLGWEVCSGGLFGLGESWEDRMQLALTLKRLNVKSAPLNFYNAVAGTPLSCSESLGVDEALRIVALFRLMLPEASIRICGGRPKIFADRVKELFHAGADSLMTGNYLTTNGNSPENDKKMITEAGFIVTKNNDAI